MFNVRSVTQFALQVTGNHSRIFSNCGVDLYTGNTFNDTISFLKMHMDLYTSIYGTCVSERVLCLKDFCQVGPPRRVDCSVRHLPVLSQKNEGRPLTRRSRKAGFPAKNYIVYIRKAGIPASNVLLLTTGKHSNTTTIATKFHTRLVVYITVSQCITC